MTNASARLAALAAIAVRRQTLVWALAVAGFAGATALAAQVRIPLPFTPVPITLQTFAVFLSGCVLGPWAGAGSQVLYVTAGVCGAPVFAGFSSGLSGASAGYLLAFPIAAWLAGLGARRQSPALLACSLLAGTVIIYALGTAWLAVVTARPFHQALAMGVLPFLPGDALKLAATWLLAPMSHRAHRWLLSVCIDKADPPHA